MTAQPIRVSKYEGQTQEEALRRFAEDSSQAAGAGYEPASQTWEGSTLLVTYRYVGARTGQGSAELYLPAIAVLLGGAIVAVGSVLPWVTAIGGFGVTVSRSGVEGGDGLITIGLGILIALLALTMIRGENLARWRGALILSAAAAALMVVDYFIIEGRIRDINRGQTVFASIGLGVWVTGIGAAIALIASVRIRSDTVSAKHARG